MVYLICTTLMLLLLVRDGFFKIADLRVGTTHRHNLALLSSTYSNQSNELTYTLYYLAPELMELNITNNSKIKDRCFQLCYHA